MDDDSAQTGWIVRYLAWMRVARRSPATIDTRRYLLARIQAAVPVPLVDATHSDLMAWLGARAGTVSDATLRQDVVGLRAFHRWLVVEGHRRDDPTVRLPMPRAPRRVPRPMPEHDVALALANGNDRMRAIIALAAMGGLRAMEIAALTWPDVDLGPEPSLFVRGKGGHEATIPIGRELAAVLRALPDRRGPVIARRDGSHRPYLPHNISHLANRYLHGLGITRSLHTLRHRAGTKAYRATKDPFAVRDFLRHASTQTTAGYAAAAGEQVRACADAVGLAS